MLKGNTKLLGGLILVLVAFYILHKSLFSFWEFNTESFRYSLEKLYLFFSAFSIIIVFILIKIRAKDLDIVGNSFLLLTTIKMIVCYIIGSSILKGTTPESFIEKWNFFALFIVFLITETIVTIILLNKED